MFRLLSPDESLNTVRRWFWIDCEPLFHAHFSRWHTKNWCAEINFEEHFGQKLCEQRFQLNCNETRSIFNISFAFAMRVWFSSSDIFVRELATIAEVENANVTRQNFHSLVIIVNDRLQATTELTSLRIWKWYRSILTPVNVCTFFFVSKREESQNATSSSQMLWSTKLFVEINAKWLLLCENEHLKAFFIQNAF